MHVPGQILVEQVEVQPEFLGIPTQVVVAQAFLVLVEKIVHLPELALRCRSLGGLGRLFGVRMRGRNREVAKDEPEPLTHAGLHFLDDRIGGAAVGTLVVSVLDQSHPCIRRALDVVTPLAHRQREDCVPLSPAHEVPPFPSSSSARRIPSAPGLMP
jgi:hypothetical protein